MASDVIISLLLRFSVSEVSSQVKSCASLCVPPARDRNAPCTLSTHAQQQTSMVV